jgi:hypothetical protein
MCGDFGRNFGEIPTLPEQTTAKTTGFCSEAREKTRQSGNCHFVDMPELLIINNFLGGMKVEKKKLDRGAAGCRMCSAGAFR